MEHVFKICLYEKHNSITGEEKIKTKFKVLTFSKILLSHIGIKIRFGYKFDS